MKPSIFEIKVSDSLSLIIPQLSCAPELFALIDNDREHLRTWLPWVDATLMVEDTRENLSDRIESFEKKEQASFYGTCDGEFAASVGFVSLGEGVGEIGYWLLSQYSGKGFMTTFVKACIEYGFEELDLDMIIIKCAEGNSKSAGIPMRLGFVQREEKETPRLRNGSDQDTLVFTLSKSDWST